MKFLFWLIFILAVLFGAAYIILDFYGYYIEWKKPLLVIAIIAPIIQGIRSVFNRPEKALLSKSNADLLSGNNLFSKSKSGYESRLKNLESKLESLENKINKI